MVLGRSSVVHLTFLSCRSGHPRQYTGSISMIMKPLGEGTSANPCSMDTSSSQSDGSDYEPTSKSQRFSHCNFPSRRSFMSKAIHPLSFPTHIPIREASDTRSTGFPEFDASQRDAHRRSSASSSVDFADVSESFDCEVFAKSYTASEGFKCELCEKFLSQRSPWSSRRIVRSGDMPVAGVLSCRHVFHAECLEQITAKTSRHEPPCPLCLKSDEANSPDQQVCNRFRNGSTRLRPLPFPEDGPSKPWGCAQAGDCVEGALLAPPRKTMLLLNRNQIKKNLSLKDYSSKEYPGKLRKVGSYSSQLLSGRSVEQGAVGCSKSTASPSTKRC